MYKLLIICIIFINHCQCCDCNLKKIKDTPNNKIWKLPLNPTVDKRQLHDTAYDSRTEYDFMEIPSEFVENGQKMRKYGLEIKQDVKDELKEQTFKVNEAEFSTTEESLPLCRYFKPGQDLDIEKMVDVWRLAFFKSSAELGCFKILLKNLRNETREYFTEKYRGFNDTVKWDDCVLQLTNGRTLDSQEETHLLQRIGNYSGLLANFVITEEFNNQENVTMISLQDHSPDQWMIADNLLLMRNCDNGDVVVFSRVPFEPSQNDIYEALDKFGEEVKEGVWACRGQNQAVLNNPRYHILS